MSEYTEEQMRARIEEGIAGLELTEEEAALIARVMKDVLADIREPAEQRTGRIRSILGLK